MGAIVAVCCLGETILAKVLGAIGCSGDKDWQLPRCGILASYCNQLYSGRSTLAGGRGRHINRFQNLNNLS